MPLTIPMWQQDYAPVAHSIGWSALVASLPMLVLLFLLAIRRKPAWISAIASLITAILMVWLVYRMPPEKIFSATLFGIAFGLLPIGWITFGAILLYRVTLETGQFEVIKNSLAMLTSDCRLQALLIAFAFGAFIEGAAAFRGGQRHTTHGVASQGLTKSQIVAPIAAPERLRRRRTNQRSTSNTQR